MFTNPTYNEIKGLKVTAASYSDALTNSAELQKQRDELTAKYNAMSPDDLKRLTQFLPDNADNIRLIIDLQKMAQAYGMTVSSTKFDAMTKEKAAAIANPSALAATSTTDLAKATREYGTFDLEFSTSGTYDNFLKFLKDVESSLRLTDIESINFDSTQVVTPASSTAPVGLGIVSQAGGSFYTYTVKLRTYWLKG